VENQLVRCREFHIQLRRFIHSLANT
jgi:hypothetical protein